MKKRFIPGIVIVVVVALAVWFMVFRRAGMYEIRRGIPEQAVFVAGTPSFDRIYEKLSQNKIWTSLKTYPYFKAYQSNLELMDSLCRTYPVLKKWLTDRPFMVSCHRVSPADFDFLYVCDLGKLNVLQRFEGMLGGMLEGAKFSPRGEWTEVIWEDWKFYYAIRANLLWFSFSEKLVAAGLAACGQEGREEQQEWSGDVMLTIDHHYLDQWIGTLTGEANPESSGLETTLLSLELKDEALDFRGHTRPLREGISLLSALNLMEGEESRVGEITGNHIAAYVSFCFSSFEELKEILRENYKIHDLKAYSEYEHTLKRLNKFLGLDLEKVFTSWMGQEIALIKPALDAENRRDNFAVAIRVKDKDLAIDQLNYLSEQIGMRTPVRFREIEYNKHTVRFLSLKGFSRLFLGPLFRKLDRPYYTLLGDYVVFSNSPATLTTMIKDYSLGNTLGNDPVYKEWMGKLGSGNNVYGYVSSPETYAYLYQVLTPGMREALVLNKGAFQSFETVGFTLANAGSGFDTRILARHNVRAAEEYELKERNRELEYFADRVESGYYAVRIPDSIAVSTRGEYAYRTEELAFTGRLSNGDPDGVWKITDKRGLLVGQCTYREGVAQGTSLFYYPDGALKAEVGYDQGKIKTYKEFFADGTLKIELEYNKGLRHGEVRVYYSTGHLFGEGKYRKGRRTGTWIYYRVTGEQEKKIRF